MNEIKCPKCATVFQVDESGYAAIVKQVRDREFLRELEAREQAHEREEKQAAELAAASAKSELERIVAARDAELAQLRERLSATQTERQLAVAQAVGRAERARDEIAAALERERIQRTSDLREAAAALEREQARRATEIEQVKRTSEEMVRFKDEEIERLRDMRARLSTKMVGESLEQHCETEFNRLRMTAFPRAYFEKDSEVVEGTKGDYIFRELDDDGTEIISIMFEMKNEIDTTASRHRNEDFFRKLDQDRKKKGCEYAILVSLLEPDSELYNAGIVDVSYRFPKMYVIRPQFFIPMITLLRSAALGALAAKRELAAVRQQNIDVTTFERKVNDFKDGFAKNYELASRKYRSAIDEIDKTIDHLNKVKDNLMSSDRNLRLANDKAERLTIRRLTRGNETMKKKFEQARGDEVDASE
ncbi:Protein of unknown function DUF2130 [Coriobacterium glomerans PW2]|uniref:DUF2130 domain-containing protein n=1 Tax=Coriobacterium glomerans (strain ATCC 49209 / DSM 20642 / JCM 10262 / PW2) TaxID=700015 RepID=F2N793_CORGP|nr:DUF2130 domain-containing protein [Coriobacterium glomerans]AEB06568.1 Protein of unknown function DUF2130 [Coriobacterium glomerans PW2]